MATARKTSRKATRTTTTTTTRVAPAATSAPTTMRTSRIVAHRRPQVGEQRTFHLIDMENLVGGAVSTQSVAGAWAEYVTAVGLREGDQVVVGVARRHAATTFFALPTGIRRLVGSNGPDGADRALLEAVDVRLVAERFDRVVIGSGDHAFTDLAAELLHRGISVVEVVGKGSPARDLTTVCGRPVRLPVRWTTVRGLGVAV